MSKGWYLHLHTASFLGLYEIRDPALDSKMKAFCNKFSSICNGIEKFFQPVSPLVNPTAVKLQGNEASSSASLKQVMHYAQDMAELGWYQYDYGSSSVNKDHYGPNKIPKIPIQNIKDKVPIYLVVGAEDDLADTTDVEWLKN